MSEQQAGATIIIPTLNEARHIGGLLNQLLAQGEAIVGEILVADGGSSDGTRAIVEQASSRHSRVRLIKNPDRIQSAGVLRAANASRTGADLLIRMDAHAGYPDDYVARLSRTIREVQTESVVVRLRTVGHTCLQKAIAAAMNSRFGTGGSAHRVGGVSGPIDHGHHAAIRRSAFLRMGGYDTAFVTNEDAEFDYRLGKEGGRIWLAADIEVEYYPRDKLPALARQYWRYGFGRAQNQIKHKQRLRPRQLIPALVVIAVMGSVPAGFAFPEFWLMPLAYAVGCALAAIILAARERSACVLLAAPALMIMHLSWGAGFIAKKMSHALRHRRITGSAQRVSNSTSGDGRWKEF